MTLEAGVVSIHSDDHKGSARANVSREILIYLAIGVFAMILRVAELDTVPLTSGEARQALATWRALNPDSPYGPVVSSSPLLLAVQGLSYSVLGPSEFSSRILTALAAIVLVLSPVLFRQYLGARRMLISSLFLALSPLLLVVSRSADAIVWITLLGLLWLRCLTQFLETRHSSAGLGVLVIGMCLVLISGPTGAMLLAILTASLMIAGRTLSIGIDRAASKPFVRWEALSHVLRSLPWRQGLLTGALVVVVIATSFLAYPAGLTNVGEVLFAGVRELAPGSWNISVAFPVVLGVFYEPAVVLLGAAAIWMALRQDALSATQRFLISWAILGTLFAAFYPGAKPGHALWFLIPISVLASTLIDSCLRRSDAVLWWTVPNWSRWLIALVLIGLLSMLAIHMQAVARGMLSAPGSPFQFGDANSINAVWVIVIALFIIIGFFLSASLWGSGTAFKGAALGFAIFMSVTSFGSGWRVAVFRSEDPVELYNRTATSLNTGLLRQTLLEVAQRESGSFPLIKGAAVVPADGVVAWLLRDFPNIEIVSDVAAARHSPIVIMPVQPEPPDLGGPYVGQEFPVTSTWDLNALRLGQLPAWWLQQRTLTGGVPVDTVVVWLRQDVYDGTHPESRS